MCRTLSGHAHWINTLALNTDYALRTSCFDPKKGCEKPKSKEEAQQIALRRYQEAIKVCGGERLVSSFIKNQTFSRLADRMISQCFYGIQLKQKLRLRG